MDSGQEWSRRISSRIRLHNHEVAVLHAEKRVDATIRLRYTLQASSSIIETPSPYQGLTASSLQEREI